MSRTKCPCKLAVKLAAVLGASVNLGALGAVLLSTSSPKNKRD